LLKDEAKIWRCLSFMCDIAWLDCVLRNERALILKKEGLDAPETPERIRHIPDISDQILA
jgi:hypothetical protein